jgi:hypothetical protein
MSNRKYLAKAVRSQKRYEASLTTKQRKQVKRIVNSKIELNHFDESLSLNTLTVGSISKLTNFVPEVGDEVFLKSLEVKFTIAPTLTAGVVRIIYFQWKANTVRDIPVPLDVLQAADVNSALKQDINNTSVKILSDRRYALPSSAGSFQPTMVSMTMKNMLKRYKTYSGVAFGNNSLYILRITDQATNAALLKHYHRINYTDA